MGQLWIASPSFTVLFEAIHDIMTTKFKPAAIASFKEWQASGVKDPCMNLSTPTSILRAYPDILDFDTDGSQFSKSTSSDILRHFGQCCCYHSKNDVHQR